MATRIQTRSQKEQLKRDLRALCDAGQLLPGEPMPTARELAQQHHMSRTVVMQTLAELISEGLLYTVPRQGTFVGRPRHKEFEFYLFVIPLGRKEGDDSLAFLQTGFEDRIAQLGGTPLTMPLDKATQHAQKGELPFIAGVFDPFPFSRRLSQAPQWSAPAATPRVHFEHRGSDDAPADVVSFDNPSGGRQATQHLIGQGYRRIAFVGWHPTRVAPDVAQEDFWNWSREREIGWRGALEDAGLWRADVEALAFRGQTHDVLPASQQLPHAAIATVAPLVARIAARRDIEAVVAANDAMAMALLNALRAAEIPHTRWPAIVGFDNLPLASGHILSSLRLPWEEVGQTAAELLWERSHGRFNGQAQQRRVAMRLIPRLTCRSDWSLSPHHDALTTITASNPLLERANTLV